MNQENLNNEANNVVTPETTPELNNNTPKKSKKKLIIIISCICLLAAAAAVYFLAFNKNKDDTKEEKNKNAENIEKNKNELSQKELAEWCGITTVGKVESNTKTFNIIYKITDYTDEQISSINAIVKNDDGKEILNENCYSLGNQTLHGLVVNSNDTISALYTDRTDDTRNFIIETLDSKGNNVSKESVVCENNDLIFEKDKEPTCKSGDGLVQGILKALKSPDVKVQKITCSNCAGLDESESSLLTCDEPKDVNAAAINSIYNKLSSQNYARTFGAGTLCYVYKVNIIYNGITYEFGITDTNDVLLGKKDGIKLDLVDPDNYESDLSSYLELFKSL